MIKILIVEDEEKIARFIELELIHEGYKVIKADNGRTGLEIAERGEADLIILDVMLPEINGLEVLRRIRKVSEVPIIMLTARDAVMDKVSGLDAGADDYITKPFNLLELIARVKSNLRRYVTLGNYEDTCKEILKSGALELNTLTKEVKIDGENIKMTPIEYKIIELLLENKGRVFSIDEIYEKVWNEESFNSENTVAVHIRRIREKIEINPKEPRFLKVVWGVGYKIEKF